MQGGLGGFVRLWKSGHHTGSSKATWVDCYHRWKTHPPRTMEMKNQHREMLSSHENACTGLDVGLWFWESSCVLCLFKMNIQTDLSVCLEGIFIILDSEPLICL